MQKLKIKGGIPLSGKINISGSKNAALPIIASSILSSSYLEISNMPKLHDVSTMIELLKTMGASFANQGDYCLRIETNNLNNCIAPYHLVKTMRASILVLGPLLAKYGKARVSLPGGCAIGARPVNLHIDGLRKMGAEITIKEGYIDAKVDRLKGAKISLDPITVTGTANLMMAATLAEGKTVIENAAIEPEIINLGECLQSMGANIDGLGTRIISIEGVDYLGEADHEIIPDRIEAATFLIAACVTKGSLRVNRVRIDHLDSVIDLLKRAGAKILLNESQIDISLKGDIKPIKFITNPYPGVPTDVQAQFMVLSVLAKGDSKITETIFENRLMHVLELQRMGANINLDKNIAYIKGVRNLSAAPVMATDLRASAALVLAGLAAKGETIIDRIYHIDRGYEEIDQKLFKLGAKVLRLDS